MLEKITPWKGEELDVDAWVEAGKPEMWFLEDSYGKYNLYQDRAFGTLALTTLGGLVLDKGKDYVSSENNEAVGLGQYYLGNECRIYLREKK